MQQPTQPMLVPKELWRLVDSLWTGGALRERNLFLSAGADAAEVRQVSSFISLKFFVLFVVFHLILS